MGLDYSKMISQQEAINCIDILTRSFSDQISKLPNIKIWITLEIANHISCYYNTELMHHGDEFIFRGITYKVA